MEQQIKFDATTVANLIKMGYLPETFDVNDWNASERLLQRQNEEKIYRTFRETEWIAICAKVKNITKDNIQYPKHIIELFNRTASLYACDMTTTHAPLPLTHALDRFNINNTSQPLNGRFLKNKEITNYRSLPYGHGPNGICMPWRTTEWQSSSYQFMHIGNVFSIGTADYINSHKQDCITLANLWTALGYTVIYVMFQYDDVDAEREFIHWYNARLFTYPCVMDDTHAGTGGLLYVIRKFP